MGTSRQPTRLLAEIDPTADGRLDGRIRVEATEAWTSFSGVLELLKALEELVDHDQQKPTQTPQRNRAASAEQKGTT
jgi:hypothetical protein